MSHRWHTLAHWHTLSHTGTDHIFDRMLAHTGTLDTTANVEEHYGQQAPAAGTKAL
jgi:S-adenosylmethionine:diacylglycerol 3-amino-3-carboxypropyl transferase